MTKPLLLIFPKLTAEELALIEPLTTNYQLITTEAITAETPLDQIEITLGWQSELGNQLLDSPTSQLKWIQAYSAGVDYFDLKRLQEKNILLSNASGVHGIPITESVIGMLLGYYRGLFTATLDQQQRAWNKHPNLSEIANKKVLIVGTGEIGRKLAQVLSVFELEVYGINRSGYSLPNFLETYPQDEINDVLPLMDIVINILPLTSQTTHFYDAERFAYMKDGVVFINVGRGPSVDSKALYDNCLSEKIAFAGIDVFEEEPLPQTSLLWELPNLLITPHISGNTLQYNQRLLTIFANNLTSYNQVGQLSQSIVALDLGY